MSRCQHRRARPSKVRGIRWWWCPDCHVFVRPPDTQPTNEYERVARHVIVDVLGRSY